MCARSARPGCIRTYTFTYNTDTTPHLTTIANSILTGEAYTFSYTGGQTLVSPFNGQSMGSTAWLNRVTVTNTGTYHQFTFNSSGEMTQILLPYKGYLSYDYTTAIDGGAMGLAVQYQGRQLPASWVHVKSLCVLMAGPTIRWVVCRS